MYYFLYNNIKLYCSILIILLMIIVYILYRSHVNDLYNIDTLITDWHSYNETTNEIIFYIPKYRCNIKMNFDDKYYENKPLTVKYNENEIIDIYFD